MIHQEFINYEYLSLLPSFIAILLALVSRNVLFSLFVGVATGLFILNDFNLLKTFFSFFDLLFLQLQQSWIQKTLIFALLVGAVVKMLEKSGGVEGIITLLQYKYKIVNSKKSALFLAYGVGIVIFIESSITSLISGLLARPFTDKYGVSRAKLAYICDTTSAPICSIILFNGWGALLLGLISLQVESGVIQDTALTWLLSAVIFNFYAYIALIVAFFSILFDINSPGMDDKIITVEIKTSKTKIDTLKGHQGHDSSKSWLLLLPILFMITILFISLYISGEGNILKGSGSTAIFNAVSITLLFMFIYYKITKVIMIKKSFEYSFYGILEMKSIVGILFLSFLLGDISSELHTGNYISTIISGVISMEYLAAIVFIFSGVIAFSTGTSWGTFSIMLPIAVVVAVSLDINNSLLISLVMGAVISGAVFGDHCSPISDTTIISSMAAKCDHITHVKTQLPFALLSGFLALILYLLVGYYFI